MTAHRLAAAAAAALLIVGLLALVPSAAAGSPYDEALVSYVVEDPVGDASVLCGADRSACDLVLFEAGNTATHVFFRITAASLATTTGEVGYRTEFKDARGTEQFVMIGVRSGGERSMRFNSDGDPLAGHEFEVDRGAATVTVWAPLESVGATMGSTMEFTRVVSYYNVVGGAGAGGSYLNNMDNVAVEGLFTIQDTGGDEEDAALGETFFEDLPPGPAQVAHNFTEATNDTYIYNWTTDAPVLTLSYNATVRNGTAAVTVVDGANETVFALNLTADADGAAAYNGTETLADALAGNWTVVVTYDGFVGEIEIILSDEEQGDEAGPTSPSPQGSPSDPSQPDGDAGDDAGTAAADDEEASGKWWRRLPGPGVLAVLAVLGVCAALVRRRQDG